ncbi:hypothetical protein C6988_05785 [Nitrosopumilus sp. b1]|uniref:hypothetical protein n=1 Tax=Nitrosopumilus sp. b1 TaxID=2109907 RepID=UPI0015F4EEDA|nr:hypothetical protein [Nitrosopumilus sp. b1]KAF6242700.1 hypothetical protein C6988_05785 [Nitrosopumilus sp. b1]
MGGKGARTKRPGYVIIMLCTIQGCDTESNRQAMVYFFEDEYTKKPACKALWRFCKNHAMMISGDSIMVRIQILN